MRKGSAFVAGGNLALAILVTVLMLALGLVWIGPVRSVVAEVGKEHGRKLQRDAEWSSRRAAIQPVRQEERRTWREDFTRALETGMLDADEPTLVARVAARFSGPSIQELEIVRVGVEEEDAAFISLFEPEGSRSLEVRRIPLLVRLRSSYRDLRRILRSAEGDYGPLRIDRIELRRDYPGVRLEAELTLWVRREVAA